MSLARKAGAAVELSGLSRLRSKFNLGDHSRAEPERRQQRPANLAPLELTMVPGAPLQLDPGSTPSRGVMCSMCRQGVRKLAKADKPAGCDCICMYCQSFGHPVKSCPRKAAQMQQQDGLERTSPQRVATRRKIAQAEDGERSLAKRWSEAKAHETTSLIEAERAAAAEKKALAELATELQLPRDEIYDKFRENDRDLGKLQEALQGERERARQYRKTVATVYRAKTPDRPSTPGTVFADAVEDLRLNEHFRQHAQKRQEARPRSRDSGQKRPHTPAGAGKPRFVSAGPHQDSRRGVVYTENLEDGIPLPYSEMLRGLARKPSAARRLHRWATGHRRRAQAGIVGGARTAAAVSGKLAAAALGERQQRAALPVRSTVAEPTEKQLAAFIGMGYHDDKLSRRAFAVADGDFNSAIQLVEMYAPCSTTA